MEILSYVLYPLGVVLEVLALIHFFRRRPDQFWIYVILFLGPLGAATYLFFVALPEYSFFHNAFRAFPRRKRINELEILIQDNPSGGNYEELGDLLMDEGKFADARSAYDKAIAARTDTPHSIYRRGLCALQLGDAAAAVPDLERVLSREADYDFNRGAGVLAQAYWMSGQKQKAEAQFQHAIASSTLSETYLNFADMLASEGRTAEARQWAQKVLSKERTMPPYLRRRERPWFQKATEMLKRLPA